MERDLDGSRLSLTVSLFLQSGGVVSRNPNSFACACLRLPPAGCCASAVSQAPTQISRCRRCVSRAVSDLSTCRTRKAKMWIFTFQGSGEFYCFLSSKAFCSEREREREVLPSGSHFTNIYDREKEREATAMDLLPTRSYPATRRHRGF